jgi:hypothetical protein
MHRGRNLAGALIVVLSALRQAPLSAHHSFVAEFDASRTLTLRGTIVTMEWVNPHCSLALDVTDDRGRVERWTFELGPPNALFRSGVRKTSLLAGQQVTVIAYPSKDGRRVASAQTVTLADGTTIDR